MLASGFQMHFAKPVVPNELLAGVQRLGFKNRPGSKKAGEGTWEESDRDGRMPQNTVGAIGAVGYLKPEELDGMQLSRTRQATEPSPARRGDGRWGVERIRSKARWRSRLEDAGPSMGRGRVSVRPAPAADGSGPVLFVAAAD